MSRSELGIGICRTESVVVCAPMLERHGLKIFDRHVAQCWNIITRVRLKQLVITPQLIIFCRADIRNDRAIFLVLIYVGG
jgi:hypothetical protein